MVRKICAVVELLAWRGALVTHAFVCVGLIDDLTASCSPGSLSQVLLLLSYLAVSQTNFKKLPSNSFDSLSRLPNLASSLALVTKNMHQSRKFATMVVIATAEHAPMHEEHLSLFVNLVDMLSLNGQGESIVSAVLTAMRAAQPDGETFDRVVGMIRACDDKFPDALEHQINQYLQETKHTPKNRTMIMTVLEKALENSIRAPILDANVTLAAAVDSHSANVRVMALEKLDKLSQSSGAMQQESETILKAALERRLMDEDLTVVEAAVGLKLLHVFPDDIIFESLMKIIDRCVSILYQSEISKKMRVLARKIAKDCISAIVSRFGSSTNSLSCLLSVILTSGYARKLSLYALHKLASSQFVVSKVLKELSSKYEKTEGQKRSRSSDAANISEHFDAKQFNLSVLEAIAKNLPEDESLQKELFAILDAKNTGYHAKSFVICAADFTLKQSKVSSKIAQLQLLSFEWFVQQWKPANDSFHLRSCDVANTDSLSAIAARQVAFDSLVACLIKDAISSEMTKLMNKSKKINSRDVFMRLAELQDEVWHQLLEGFLQNVDDQIQLCEGIWSPIASGKSNEENIASIAIQLWAKCAATSKLSDPSRILVAQKFPMLLCALCHQNQSIRLSAVSASKDLFEGLNNWWPKKGKNSTHKHAVQCILQVCLDESTRIASDSDGLEFILSNLMSNANESKDQQINLSAAEVSTMTSYFMSTLQDQKGLEDLAFVPFLLRVLHDTHEATQLHKIIGDILNSIFLEKADKKKYRKIESDFEREIAFELVNTFNDPILINFGGKPLDAFEAIIAASQWEGEHIIREQAILALGQWVENQSIEMLQRVVLVRPLCFFMMAQRGIFDMIVFIAGADISGCKRFI